MPSRFEPDDRFVDRLEWQLASEFRRKDRLKPAAGKVVLPKSAVVFGLAAVVLLMGVAATKAADLIKDSWRKRIEVARLETENRIGKALLDLKREHAAQAETRFSMGLISEEEAVDSKRTVDWATFEVEKTRLDLDEVRGSGEAPRDELYAPLVRGRDFVSERLDNRKKALEADLALQRASIERKLEIRVGLGLLPKSDLEEFKMSMRVRAGEVEDIERSLSLRRRYVSGEISAEDLEIQARRAEAERELREALNMVEILKSDLDELRPREAAGLVSPDEAREARFRLESAQAQADRAAQVIEILKKIK